MSGEDLLRPPAAADRYHTLAVEVSDGTLHCGVWEPRGNSTPEGTVLVIHGITATHLSWQWLAQALPAWRVIAPDLRGRGRSAAIPGPFGLAAHAADLAAVLDRAGVTQPIPVIGHSMGGFIALVLADLRPELVDQLLLVDGGIPVELPAGVAPEDALEAVLGPTAQRLSMEFPSAEAVDAYWQNHPGLGAQWGPEMAAYATYDTVGEPPHLRSTTPFTAMAEDSKDIQLGEALPHALADLRHPALFLRAERGLQNQPAGMFSEEWAARWAEQLPHLSVRDVPDTNHFTIIMSHRGSAAIARAMGGSTPPAVG